MSALKRLIDEAETLEALEKELSERQDQAVWQSDEWRRNDPAAAVETAAARAAANERAVIVARLDQISEEIAQTPAADLEDAVRKLAYLAGMLDGIEAEIAASLQSDLVWLSPTPR
jgi:hypothetical protein